MPSIKATTALLGAFAVMVLAGCASDARSLEERQQDGAAAGETVMPFDLEATTDTDAAPQDHEKITGFAGPSPIQADAAN